MINIKQIASVFVIFLLFCFVYSLGSWFLLVERAVIISLMSLLVVLCAAQLSVIGKYWLFNSLQLLICPEITSMHKGIHVKWKMVLTSKRCVGIDPDSTLRCGVCEAFLHCWFTMTLLNNSKMFHYMAIKSIWEKDGVLSS